MHHQIDSLAYSNKLRSLHSEHKLIFALSLFVLGYIAPVYIQILIVLWLIIWVVIYAGIPFKVYGKLLAIPLSFWLTSSPALIFGIIINSPNQNLQQDMIWGIKLGQIWLYISHRGLEQTLTAFTRTLCLTSCMYLILLTVPFAEIIRVLQKWRCPSLITDLLFLMYRFIFVLTQTATELITAQKSRLGYINWKTGIKSISLVTGQLLQRSIVSYRQISLGLVSRGFTGELKVWHSRRHYTNWRYVHEAIGGYCFLLILVSYTKIIS